MAVVTNTLTMVDADLNGETVTMKFDINPQSSTPRVQYFFDGVEVQGDSGTVPYHMQVRVQGNQIDATRSSVHIDGKHLVIRLVRINGQDIIFDRNEQHIFAYINLPGGQAGMKSETTEGVKLPCFAL